jgi:hypothetical protein
MEDKLVELESIYKGFEPLGRGIFSACGGNLFPADALFLASCNRSLQVLDAFILLIRNNHYSCSVVLLRIQLDTVLRLHGITRTKDVHATAHEVIQGKKLSTIKDKNGNALQDFYLVNLIAKDNPRLKHIYKLCSGYIHFSDQIFFHLLHQSESIPNSEERIFNIGANESKIDVKHTLELIQAFKVVTVGIQNLIQEWMNKRHVFGTNEELKKTYKYPYKQNSEG